MFHEAIFTVRAVTLKDQFVKGCGFSPVLWSNGDLDVESCAIRCRSCKSLHEGFINAFWELTKGGYTVVTHRPLTCQRALQGFYLEPAFEISFSSDALSSCLSLSVPCFSCSLPASPALWPSLRLLMWVSGVAQLIVYSCCVRVISL